MAAMASQNYFRLQIQLRVICACAAQIRPKTVRDDWRDVEQLQVAMHSHFLSRFFSFYRAALNADAVLQ